MFKVIERFRDLQDDHIYEIGDKYPWDKRQVSKKRIKELSTDANALGKVFIEKVEEKGE